VDSVNSIIRIIVVGFTLLGIGTLLDVTAALRNQAAKDQSQGLFSLGKWNRTLFKSQKHEVSSGKLLGLKISTL